MNESNNYILEKLRISREFLHEIYEDLDYEEKDIKKYEKPKYQEEIKEKDIPKTKKKKKAPKTTITANSILKIASHALKYANYNIHRNRWVEVIGLLSGKLIKTNNTLLIKNAYPMGHGNAIFAEIKDYQNYARVWKDIRKNNEFIIGWYHSHPSYSPFMSDEDFGTQVRYQKLWDRAVALVIDPFEIDGTRLGFKIFNADLRKRTWSAIPFKVREKLNVKKLPKILRKILKKYSVKI